MAIKIKPSDITYLVEEMARLHETGEPSAFEAQFFILLKRHGKGRPAKVFAIMERMRCLLKLMRDDRMRGWTLEGEKPGCTLTNGAVFAATAQCRLLDKDDTFAFDPDEFFTLLLQLTPADGSA